MISINQANEQNIGDLIAFIQSTVYNLCVLLDVNWSNNPKVIIGKDICNTALKTKSSAEQRRKTREEVAKSVFNQDFYEL